MENAPSASLANQWYPWCTSAYNRVFCDYKVRVLIASGCFADAERRGFYIWIKYGPYTPPQA